MKLTLKMKREIKFRAWDVETNKMIINFFIRTFGNKDDLILIPDKNVYDKVFDISYSENRLKVMQYTGMKDINGKEVYEGDIVKELNQIFEIGFRNGRFGAINKKHTEELEDYVNHQYIKQECKVIGNIYENKELLK